MKRKPEIKNEEFKYMSLRNQNETLKMKKKKKIK